MLQQTEEQNMDLWRSELNVEQHDGVHRSRFGIEPFFLTHRWYPPRDYLDFHGVFLMPLMLLPDMVIGCFLGIKDAATSNTLPSFLFPKEFSDRDVAILLQICDDMCHIGRYPEVV
jgi:hypothetical protein